jgi:hypothetical protein
LAVFFAGRRFAALRAGFFAGRFLAARFLAAFFRAGFFAAFFLGRGLAFFFAAGRAAGFAEAAGRAAGAAAGVGAGAGGGVGVGSLDIGNGSIQPEPDQPISRECSAAIGASSIAMRRMTRRCVEASEHAGESRSALVQG